ncbi:uncharacterized protein LOC113294213 [Papaver somniferum]|uniref:uncharacterized protein LOC113294213 n=1 Tax=Papaver somniferum TaxID=3469 RepID=UPI000E704BF8|nr:uncharacterized protein LOC113294213 [Papaver somniferum]
MVESASGNDRLSLLDEYKGYNQIPLAEEDQEHTAFYAPRGLYCYTKMPFGLKNAGATYHRMGFVIGNHGTSFFTILSVYEFENMYPKISIARVWEINAFSLYLKVNPKITRATNPSCAYKAV